MKKIALLLAVVLLLSLCSLALADAVNLADLDLKTKKMVFLNSPFEMNGKLGETYLGFNTKENTLVVPTYSELVAALQGGRADYTVAPYITAQYLVRTEPEGYDLAVLPNITAKMQMILRKGDQELCDAVSAAIGQMKESGLVYTLLETLVYGVDNVSEANAAGEATLFEGKDTLYVGVSGELPPMDYVAADGRAAGFNVALVQEIAKILEKNVVFVIVPSEAKYQALLSEKIDIFFWHGGVIALPDDIIGTDPYVATGVGVVVKK